MGGCVVFIVPDVLVFVMVVSGGAIVFLAIREVFRGR
jgi:hypothetical protein